MKEVCTSSLLLLFVDILTLVQLVSPDNNYCLFNPVKGLSGNAVHACKDNTTSGSIVAMDISHFDGSECFCQLRYTGEIDNHTTVEVYYRTQDENLSHRIELFAVSRNNDTEGLKQTTKTLQVFSGGPTNITVRSKSTRSLREGKLCVGFKLEKDPYNLTLTCFNAAYSEQDLGMKTENPNVVKPQSTQTATTLLQTTHRRTSTTTAIPTTHTTTTTVVQSTPRSTSTITTSQKINKKTSLDATTTVVSSSNTVSTQRVKQTSDVTVKNSATIEYIVNSEENDNPTAAIQAGTVKIIIVVGVSAVVCIVAVVLVVCCLKRRRRQMSRATVSQQSTHQNDEDYEITENAMYIPYIPTNDRNADCDNIYEEADIDTNQSGKEATSLLQVHEVSRKDVDPIDNTLK